MRHFGREETRPLELAGPNFTCSEHFLDVKNGRISVTEVKTQRKTDVLSTDRETDHKQEGVAVAKLQMKLKRRRCCWHFQAIREKAGSANVLPCLLQFPAAALFDKLPIKKENQKRSSMFGRLGEILDVLCRANHLCRINKCLIWSFSRFSFIVLSNGSTARDWSIKRMGSMMEKTARKHWFNRLLIKVPGSWLPCLSFGAKNLNWKRNWLLHNWPCRETMEH